MLCINTFGRVRFFPDQAKKKIQNGRTSTLMVVKLQSGNEIALQYNQREIPKKISKAELWFLCMKHRLFVLYNCMKFHFYSFNGCQGTERTRNSIANDQREITPKISKAELSFLCMTHCFIVLYNCMKFHLNNFNGCQLTERTRNSIANDQRVITPKISKAELRFSCMTHRLNVL